MKGGKEKKKVVFEKLKIKWFVKIGIIIGF